MPSNACTLIGSVQKLDIKLFILLMFRKRLTVHTAKLFLNCQLASPILRAGDIAFNSKVIIKLAELAIQDKKSLLILPELALTGGFLQDLQASGNILDQVQHYLQDILLASASWPNNFALVFGAPLITDGGQYNAALAISGGRIIQKVTACNLPSAERQQFLVPDSQQNEESIFLLPIFGPYNPLRVQMVVGEDIYHLKTNKADLVLHIANTAFTSKNSTKLQAQLSNLALMHKQAVLHVNSSVLSPSDLYYHQAEYQAYESDLCLTQHKVKCSDYLSYAQTNASDLTAKLAQIDEAAKISYSKSRCCSISVPRLTNAKFMRKINLASSNELPAIAAYFDLQPAQNRLFNPAPYLYQSPTNLAKIDYQGLSVKENDTDKAEYYSAFWLACAESLLKHLYTAHAKKFVLGLSGGLDSCVALISCFTACNLGKLPLDTIQAVSMPGFGSSKISQNQAAQLLEALSITAETIDIKAACLQHFKDIKQASDNYDVTYENAQARERTQILMDKANQVNGIVVGTGDLSEECLGFCTYNGDQMSMFNPNASIPKSLMPSMLASFTDCLDALQIAEKLDKEALALALRKIYEANVSPELLPLTSNGEQKQVTQEVVGSYVLHDFFFYHLADANYCLEDLLKLAIDTFSAANMQALVNVSFDFGPQSNVFAKKSFSAEEIIATLNTFARRYIQQQFKRLPSPASVNFTAYNLANAWHIPSDLAINSLIHQKY